MSNSYDPIRYDFNLPNSGDYQYVWEINDQATGDPLLAAGDTVTITIRSSPGVLGDSVLALTDQTDDTTTGTWVDTSIYEPTVTIREADILALPLSLNNQFVGYYTLEINYSDSFDTQYAYGRVTLDMGTT